MKNLIQRLLGRSDIYFGGESYMRRWRFPPIFQTWLPGVRLHQILRSDVDRELHDHPFDFVSIILKGGYWEHSKSGSRRWYGPGSIIVRRAETLHRLELNETPAWTFVFRSRIRRAWGFQTSKGWVHWRDFTFLKGGQGVEAGAFSAPSSL